MQLGEGVLARDTRCIFTKKCRMIHYIPMAITNRGSNIEAFRDLPLERSAELVEIGRARISQRLYGADALSPRQETIDPEGSVMSDDSSTAHWRHKSQPQGARNTSHRTSSWRKTCRTGYSALGPCWVTLSKRACFVSPKIDRMMRLAPFKTQGARLILS